jgi:hypothetical protein
LSGKDNVSRNNWMLCTMICYAWWFMDLVFLFVCFTQDLLGFKDFSKTQVLFVCFTLLKCWDK